MGEEKLTTVEKLQRTADHLNNGEKLNFAKYQTRYYLAYDYNANSITQLVNGSPLKYQSVIYCLSQKFKEYAIKWIGKEELINYLKG